MKKRVSLLLLMFLVFQTIFAQPKILDLNGEWLIQTTNNEYSTTTEVPGSILATMVERGFLADPFYGLNEGLAAEFYNKDWNYTKEFQVSKEFLSRQNIFLTLDGVDSVSTIFVNGKIVGETFNMHLQYKFDVKKFLVEGTNQILITIDSPTKIANQFVAENGRTLTHNGGCALPGVAYLRKAWFSFGWDWGPKLPDLGIWRAIYLESPDTAAIDSYYVTQTISDDLASLTIEVTATEYEKSDLTAKIKLSDSESNYLAEIDLAETTTATIDVKNPKLWWTRELGEQHLYNLEVQLFSNGTLVDTKSQRLGLRTIELIRDPDARGETFYFRLNGVAIFAKGANWIPSDSFIPRGTKNNLIEKRLQDAVDANFNMVRVWGGGIYEEERFYDFCEENGLLVWQDFAYACNPTPDLGYFYEEVEKEAEYNIKRLRNKTSLALWCGNNEIEEAWKWWAYVLLWPEHKDSHVKIFDSIIPSIVNKLDPNTSYWASSPSNGIGYGGDPNSPDRGDSHYWGVWHMSQPFSAYRKFNSRFMSEFGFQSFPEMKTIAQFAPEDQHRMFSPIMKNHQKNKSGNGRILKYMRRRFAVPIDFEKQTVLSQLTQAEAMEYGVDHWRKNRNNFECMGALYWQLNDCWPVASWSSIDYYGRWKALQYFAKRFYEPVYCSVAESRRDVEFWGVNDRNYPVETTLKWTIAKADGTIVNEGEKTTTLPAADSVKIEYLDLRKETFGVKKHQLLIYWELYDAEGKMIVKGGRTFSEPKKIWLKNPKLETTIAKSAANTFKLDIKANEMAMYVYIKNNTHDFRASDNFFYLKKGEVYTITVTTPEDLSLDEFKSTTKTESLYDLK
ncbi:MAG: glycoside hydrolase family 2 protein [Spirochaetales bacterium]|nr:glycoside hydrolase family 2 protein [Spirochaetales bacterium]